MLVTGVEDFMGIQIREAQPSRGRDILVRYVRSQFLQSEVEYLTKFFIGDLERNWNFKMGGIRECVGSSAPLITSLTVTRLNMRRTAT